MDDVVAKDKVETHIANIIAGGQGGQVPPTFLIGGGGNGMFVPPHF